MIGAIGQLLQPISEAPRVRGESGDAVQRSTAEAVHPPETAPGPQAEEDDEHQAYGHDGEIDSQHHAAQGSEERVPCGRGGPVSPRWLR